MKKVAVLLMYVIVRGAFKQEVVPVFTEPDMHTRQTLSSLLQIAMFNTLAKTTCVNM